MKSLLAAGMPSCYQIGPAFRAGESGRWHNTEFTMLEWYELDVTLEDLMANVAALAESLIGPQPVLTKTVDDLLKETYSIDPHHLDEERCLEIASAEGLRGARDFYEALDFLVGASLEKLGDGRIFITEYPRYQACIS